jgi:hypothetical protein
MAVKPGLKPSLPWPWGGFGRTLRSRQRPDLASVCAQNVSSRGHVSEDLVDAPSLNDGRSPSGVEAIMGFADLYPTVPLQTLVNEVRHADSAVPLGADDRNEVIAWLVKSRLGDYNGQLRDNKKGSSPTE